MLAVSVETATGAPNIAAFEMGRGLRGQTGRIQFHYFREFLHMLNSAVNVFRLVGRPDPSHENCEEINGEKRLWSHFEKISAMFLIPEGFAVLVIGTVCALCSKNSRP